MLHQSAPTVCMCTLLMFGSGDIALLNRNWTENISHIRDKIASLAMGTYCTLQGTEIPDTKRKTINILTPDNWRLKGECDWNIGDLRQLWQSGLMAFCLVARAGSVTAEIYGFFCFRCLELRGNHDEVPDSAPGVNPVAPRVRCDGQQTRKYRRREMKYG